MTHEANQIALEVVRSILDAARPATVQVAGTQVSITVTRDPAPPWPEVGLPGVAPQPTLPAPIRAECTWPGGKATLFVEVARETVVKYVGDVCLAVFTDSRRLVLWCNVRAAIERADGQTASISALAAVVKRRAAAAEQPEINTALRKLVADAALPLATKRKVLIANVRLPEGDIAGGATAAFERALLLALIKLDFVARRGIAKRGVLVDFTKLQLSDEALAALARSNDDTSDEDADDDSDDDDDPLARIRKRVEAAIPDAAERRGALELLAYAVENAHDERPTGWFMKARGNDLWLVTGRLAACRIGRSSMALSVMGPISPETRAELAAEEEETEDWKAIPGGLYLKFPAAKASVALERLRDPFDRFVDEAMARMRRRIDPDRHVPEAITYLAQEVGRPLPQPELGGSEPEESGEDDSGVDEVATSREPVVRGRAPIFDKGHRSIVSLLSEIEQGRIALPDLQRPFVWEDTKVRDLLDSLFVGFPAGTVVLWRTDDPRDARTMGGTAKAPQASSLVIDGQQRLTSLYAVIKGIEVVDKDGDRRQIKIAFRPRDGKFEVPDAAIQQDPEYLADVSELWRATRSKRQIRKDLLDALKAKGRVVDGAYEEAVEHNLDRVKAIDDFEFPVVEIRKDEATDEDVAEIFVRINNQGMRLGQADFVLTLLSVFHGDLRDRIEARAAAISRESVVAIDTQQLLRATCAVGFERARMSAIYKFLRGVEPNTGETSGEARKMRLEKLDLAADACMNPTTWRDYLLRVAHAGFVNQALVASPNAVVNAFAFYVKGQQAALEKHRLDQLISRWLFGTLLTRRYSGSSETAFEADLNRTRGVGSDGESFARALDGALSESITGDYWSRTLVAELRTQRGRAPSALAFRAAQIVLGARALFSDQLLQTLLTPGPSAARSASEQHHLFPKAWLMKKAITDRREINQVANLADVGWAENGEIGASGPSSYVPRLRDKLGLDDGRWGRMCAEHALPIGWENLPYDVFLQQRRERMADIIRAAYRKLGGEEDAAPIAPPWFLPGAELVWSRIVETERGLRALVRDVYVKRFASGAAAKIEANIPEGQRESLSRALRSRPAGADAMSVVDYLYIAQLPPLLFSNDVWSDAKERLGNAQDVKQRLSNAITQITPVRNEIAHVREVPPDRLQRADVACKDVLSMIGKT
jgi:hypothetical protein